MIPIGRKDRDVYFLNIRIASFYTDFQYRRKLESTCEYGFMIPHIVNFHLLSYWIFRKLKLQILSKRAVFPLNS